MAKETTTVDGNGATAPTAQPVQASLNTLAQYVKDFSFENPRAPASLQNRQEQPQIAISVNVNATSLSNDEFEVGLQIEANAKAANEILFNVELLYAGIFRITGIARENVHPVLLIECPRLLFPFARQIVSDATRDGGFPPLMIDPIDFAGLYRQRLAEAQASAEKSAETKTPEN
ncbi:MAG: protein-export chaperone SecB [Rhizobiales bacterium]|nr:protein-export chaperone SecB [Hyphomicrobiales bacterium]